MSQFLSLSKEVIDVVKNVKDVIIAVIPEEKQETVIKGVPVKDQKVAILCSKALDIKDLETLRQMGKTYFFKDNDVHNNLNVIDFEYIVFDMLNSVHSHYIMNADTSKILQVGYVYFYEKSQQWIKDFECVRAMCHLPPPQANRDLFNNLLRSKSFSLPETTFVSVFKYIKKTLLSV
jgi:hypothetical protein